MTRRCKGCQNPECGAFYHCMEIELSVAAWEYKNLCREYRVAGKHEEITERPWHE